MYFCSPPWPAIIKLCSPLQVNIDLSQFLYHEVFGKLPNDHHPPGNHLPLHPMMPHPPPPHGPPLHHHAIVPSAATSAASSVHDVGGMAPILINGQMGPPTGHPGPPTGHPGVPAATSLPSSVNLDQKPDPAMMVPPPGTELGEIKYSAAGGDMESQNCEVCGKSFQYRYQLIVHRRYHVERKPFTCQVSGHKQELP